MNGGRGLGLGRVVGYGGMGGLTCNFSIEASSREHCDVQPFFKDQSAAVKLWRIMQPDYLYTQPSCRPYNQISCQISIFFYSRSLGKISKPAMSFIPLFRLRIFLKSTS
jgi:hypothetical protein